MADYMAISPLSSGIAGGIIGAIIIFLTTLNGTHGRSKVAKLLESSVWKKYGYKVSVGGAFWGAVIGFIYGFIIWFIFSIVYNSLI
jgi:hypothetical protein